MYTNIKKNFNYWPKLGAKIILIYSGFSLLGNIMIILGSLSQGLGDTNIYTLLHVLPGLTFHIVLFLYFLNVLKAQSTLKNAYIGKIMRKKFHYSEEQVEAALAQIDSEVASPVYSDTATKNTFMITQNWVIGASSGLMRAMAVRITDIKNYERLVVENRGKSTSYGYYLVVKNHADEEFHFRLGSSDLMDEAAYELAAAMKNVISPNQAVLEESVFVAPQGTDMEGMLSEKDRAEVIKMLKNEGPVQAIKYAREATGLGLKEAKELVDKIQREIGK
ncbi:MAG: ribosomal protein L7/L12 [Lachnospiraceae bacterium]